MLEDDERLREALVKGLQERSFVVDSAATVSEARALIFECAGAYDAAVLDLMLPDGSPLDLLAECVEAGFPLNAMILSAHGAPEARIAALKAGALDFVAKPIRMKELGLRVQHLASRRPAQPIEVPIRVGGVTLDRARQLVFTGDRQTRLTPTQFRVFHYLMVNRNRLVPVQELIDHCWDRNTDSFSNPVHSQVSRLRRIFEGEVLLVHDQGGYRVQPAEGPEPPRMP